MGALLDGVYDGAVAIRELLQHGNFGPGTFNGLDGQMLVLDGDPCSRGRTGRRNRCDSNSCPIERPTPGLPGRESDAAWAFPGTRCMGVRQRAASRRWQEGMGLGGPYSGDGEAPE